MEENKVFGSQIALVLTDSESESIGPGEVTEVEGGIEGWMTVAGSFLVYYSSFGIINSFGFFQDYYQTEFLKTTSPSTIAFIGTLQIALMNSLSSVSGALCDRHGIRYLYIGSGVGTAGALLALSFSRPGAVWQVFLSQGLLMGCTIAFGAQPALTVAGQHFKKRRALAMGVVSAGTAAGGVAFPIMFAKLMPIIGFGWCLRLAAVKTLLCYGIALWISTSKPAGKAMLNGWTSLLDFKGFLDCRYSVLSAAAWTTQLGIWTPYFYTEAYCAIVYPNTPLRGYMLPLTNATSLFGTIIGGLMGDRVGRLNLLWPMTLISGILSLTMWYLAPTVEVLIAYVCLYGLCTGFYVALLPPVIGQISPDEKLGARIGSFYTLVATAGLIGNPIGGALIKEKTKEGYVGLILYSGCTMIVGAFAMLAGRFLHGKDLRAKW
ncbi:MFS general substrate transporter [Amniculicola lignicola CBS 123094]|uniref:MFS general substrate transporter n=1 Tax=Amniculicola lignicola CBS 123094 TaxID=1392246 RepID=A0A6A5WPL2_9PLEO|nr:MFS general substrate transporter [Amniculicola lignicola CBS 123094]